MLAFKTFLFTATLASVFMLNFFENITSSCHIYSWLLLDVYDCRDTRKHLNIDSVVYNILSSTLVPYSKIPRKPRSRIRSKLLYNNSPAHFDQSVGLRWNCFSLFSLVPSNELKISSVLLHVTLIPLNSKQ